MRPAARRGTVVTLAMVGPFLVAACSGPSGDVSGPTPSRVLHTSAPPAPRPTEVTDPEIAAYLDKTLPAGASGGIAIARGDELVHCAGFGSADKERRIAADCDTAYDVMSMTKQFTAAAVLRLRSSGELRLDDTIDRFFDDVPADKRAITVHQLLTHTAGFTELLGGDYQPLSRDDMIAKAMASTLVAQPGAEYHYSNVGYSLLAALVEIVSGRGYEEYLADELFSPAGMHDTGYVLPDWRSDQVAVEYDADGAPQGRPFEHPWADDGPYWNLRGNGGIISTPRDMYRWHLALTGDAVLDDQARSELFTPYVLEEPTGTSSYGYGWVIQRTPFGRVAAHDGGNGWSYGEVIRLLRDDVMIFWITNEYRSGAEHWNLARLAPTLDRGLVEIVEQD